jgi:hypothetical protein
MDVDDIMVKEKIWFILQIFILLAIWGMDGDEYGALRGWI